MGLCEREEVVCGCVWVGVGGGGLERDNNDKCLLQLDPV